MEKRQISDKEFHEFNWVFTCKFSIFAQKYTGLQDTEELMAFIEEQDQMRFVDNQSNGEFLTETDLIAIWDSMVELQVQSQMENGIYILNLTVFTPDFNNSYNGSVVECDCVNIKELLHNIINDL